MVEPSLLLTGQELLFANWASRDPSFCRWFERGRSESLCFKSAQWESSTMVLEAMLEGNISYYCKVWGPHAPLPCPSGNLLDGAPPESDCFLPPPLTPFCPNKECHSLNLSKKPLTWQLDFTFTFFLLKHSTKNRQSGAFKTLRLACHSYIRAFRGVGSESTPSPALSPALHPHLPDLTCQR